MRIVIGGGGKVGEFLCQELSKANHDIWLIEMNEEILQNIIDKTDITGVLGNVASYDTLLEAGVGSADMFIAVTEKDEVNMIAAILAKHMGAAHTTVRVRSSLYTNHNDVLNKGMGLDLIISPEHDAAVHIADMIRHPHALNVETFSQNRVSLIELHIEKDSLLNGIKLIDFKEKFGNILVTVIQRDNNIIIPTGADKLLIGDNIFIVGSRPAVNHFYKALGRAEKTIHSILILGGGNIAYDLAKMLEPSGREITIIEVDPERAQFLADSLPNVRILLGDGSEQDFLEEARIDSYDCMVTLTGIDEENIIASLFAHYKKVRKVITKVNRTNILRILKNQGLDAVITPKYLVTNRILKKVRSVESSMSSNVDDVYRIAGNRAEALMFTVSPVSRALKILLKDLPIRPDTIVACIIRNGQIIYPGGNDFILSGDQVLIVTGSKKYDDIDDMLEEQK